MGGAFEAARDQPQTKLTTGMQAAARGASQGVTFGGAA